MSHKVILMILDGWGVTTNPEVSAIHKANTPFIDSLYKKYPNTTLEASGMAVGLPDGQMGNSEVGHMNIGAGRIVYQDLVKINKAIKENTLKDNPTLKNALEYAKNNQKKLHFFGLVSDGGVHSHINHLKGLCSIAKEYGLEDVFIHAFTDGRDTDPMSGLEFLEDLENHLQNSTGKIASIIGRYYAMDRDNRWERVKKAYDLLTQGIGEKTQDWKEAIKKSYANEITDEFIEPIVCIDENENLIAKIEEGDVVLCFNFRTDRGREITQALTQENFPEQKMQALDLHYVTMTNYDESFQNIQVIFDKDNLQNTLGEVIAKAGKKQIRIAETEKYPHVTFFFSGGREENFKGEKRILCNSPKVATYDLKPEMSAECVQNKIIAELKTQETDFICLNFANPDMVGHTGVFEAAVKACETVDKCTEAVVNTALENEYVCIIIADHGNADFMLNEDGSPHTAHTTSLVPCFLVGDKQENSLQNGKLANIAPTILELLDIPKPQEMSENSLILGKEVLA